MGFLGFFTPRCRALIERDGCRFEVEGDANFVEYTLKEFMAHLERRVLPTLEPIAGEVAQPSPAQPLVNVSTVSGAEPWHRRRRKYIQLHAMDGDLSRVYPLDRKRMESSPLSRAVDLTRIRNIYVEAELISNNFKGDHKTVWNAVVPSDAEP